jgi:hypothetical protein
MNIKTVNQDIASLEKALKLIEKTENYLHFNKSHLMLEICEQINVLKDKRDRQETYIKTLNHESI